MDAGDVACYRMAWMKKPLVGLNEYMTENFAFFLLDKRRWRLRVDIKIEWQILVLKLLIVP